MRSLPLHHHTIGDAYATGEDWSHVFGDAPMVQSTSSRFKTYTNIGQLNTELEGKEVLVRGFLTVLRGGKSWTVNLYIPGV